MDPGDMLRLKTACRAPHVDYKADILRNSRFSLSLEAANFIGFW